MRPTGGDLVSSDAIWCACWNVRMSYVTHHMPAWLELSRFSLPSLQLSSFDACPTFHSASFAEGSTPQDGAPARFINKQSVLPHWRLHPLTSHTHRRCSLTSPRSPIQSSFSSLFCLSLMTSQTNSQPAVASGGSSPPSQEEIDQQRFSGLMKRLDVQGGSSVPPPPPPPKTNGVDWSADDSAAGSRDQYSA